MEQDVEWKISISVNTIFVADARAHAVYAIDRVAFSDQETVVVNDKDQFIASESSQFVRKVTDDPYDILHGHLWVESGNEVDVGYHKQQNEA